MYISTYIYIYEHISRRKMYQTLSCTCLFVKLNENELRKHLDEQKQTSLIGQRSFLLKKRCKPRNVGVK